MKLIIDIPEETYNAVIDDEWIDTEPIHNMVNAIKNGTPLPKGHGRLIDEPTEEKIANTIGGKNDFADCIREAVKTVFANAPTIIEADKENKE